MSLNMKFSSDSSPSIVDHILIYRTWVCQYEQIDTLSKHASLKEIRDNDYNLNITRYVSLAKEKAQIDLTANHAQLTKIEVDIKASKDRLNVYLKELGLETL